MVEGTGADVVSVAVSGGGHRASAWALGVMQAVLDAGLGSKLSSVTSVSGGSITNAVVAHAVDLHTVDRAGFDTATARLQEVIADDGLFFTGPRTDAYVRRTFGVGCLVAAGVVATIAAAVAGGRSGPLWWALAGVLPLAAAALSAKGGGTARFGKVGSKARWLLTLAVLVAIGGAAGAMSTSSVSPILQAVITIAWLVATLALGRALLAMLGRRGQVVVEALEDEFFHGKPLGEVTRAVDHIFATTDLETADSLYLAPRFVASYRRGITTADGITLAQAAQASAALPLGFPPSALTPSKPFVNSRLPAGVTAKVPIEVSDGGAYDNMGDQWDIRRPARLAEWDEAGTRPAGLGADPNLLIVANASGAWVWENWKASSPLGREVTSIAKNQGIQYDQTTATRRRVLFDTFAAALRDGSGLRGILIQIDRTPFQVVDQLPSADAVGETKHAAIQQRADQARTALAKKTCTDPTCDHINSSCTARVGWNAAAKFNAGVPTTLGPIGTTARDALLAHARTSTAMYLYVLHDIGTLDHLDPPPRTTSA